MSPASIAPAREENQADSANARHGITSEEADVFLSVVNRLKWDLNKGANETPENVDNVLKYLSTLVKEKSVGVKRVKTKFRERRVSSRFILKERQRDEKNTEYKDLWTSLTDDETKYRHEMVTGLSERYKPTPGLFFVLKPEVEEVKIFDSKSPIDYLFQYKAYFVLHIIVSITCAFTGFFAAIPFSPLIWMDVTDTVDIFFNETSISNGTIFTTSTFPTDLSSMPKLDLLLVVLQE